jgi:hypothetical protein
VNTKLGEEMRVERERREKGRMIRIQNPSTETIK